MVFRGTVPASQCPESSFCPKCVQHSPFWGVKYECENRLLHHYTTCNQPILFCFSEKRFRPKRFTNQSLLLCWGEWQIQKTHFLTSHLPTCTNLFVKDVNRVASWDVNLPVLTAIFLVLAGAFHRLCTTECQGQKSLGKCFSLLYTNFIFHMFEQIKEIMPCTPPDQLW